MAKTNLQVAGIGLFCLALLARQREAYEFTAGGSAGWSVPSDPNVNILNQWAEKKRFQITDSIGLLSFFLSRQCSLTLRAGNDSVLYVDQDDYKSCNTTTPIAKYVDGHTVFKFNRSGPFYFISGNTDNCLKNEKLVIVVLANRSEKSIASSPPPSESTGTSPPSPSPSAIQAPSSPPAGTVEINPTPAPAEAEAPSSKEPSPGNNTGTVLVSLAISVGALVASSLFLAP